MRIFRELYNDPLETVILNQTTTRRNLAIDELPEDINSLAVSYQEVETVAIEADIRFNGFIASSEIEYFRSNREDLQNIYQIPGDRVNSIEILVSSITSYDISFDIIINNQKIDTITFNSQYILDTVSSIFVPIPKMECSLRIVKPHLLRLGEGVRIRQFYFSRDQEPDTQKFFFDEVNLMLIFDKNYSNLNLIINSLGSVVRPTSLNNVILELKGYPCIIDTAEKKILLTERILLPKGSTIQIIDQQEIEIDELTVPINYSLLGIYLDEGVLGYTILARGDTYTEILMNSRNVELPEGKDFISYAILLNAGEIIVTDFFPLGFGSGGGGGLIKKCTDVTGVEEITLDFLGGNTVPTVTVFDDDFVQVFPEEVRMFGNNVIIKFGQIFSGRICIN